MSNLAKLALAALLGLAGCGAGPQVSTLEPGLRPGQGSSLFDKAAESLDHPERIFAQAGYTPLWTLSQEEASSRLPKGLKAVPHEVRLWEPWFRKHLTNGSQQLSTSDLLRIKSTVIQTVANDPACQFVPGQKDAAIIQSIEAARKKALSSLGIHSPSTVLVQMTRADAAWARCKSQRRYSYRNQDLEAIEDGQNRYPNLSEINQEDHGLSCARSCLEMIYILRGLENLSHSGLTVGSCFVFNIGPGGKIDLHGLNGVMFNLPSGNKAHSYYDPTAARGSFNGSLDQIMKNAGPLDLASIERVANRHCIAVTKESPDENKRKIQVVTYNYILGENWPQLGIGNFDRSACPDYGIYGGGTDYETRLPGMRSFQSYWTSNMASINSLESKLSQALRGEL